MEERQNDILELQKFTKSAETKIATILQSLQWDVDTLMKKPTSVLCKYDNNHTISAAAAESHERKCFYKYNGYSINDQLLPDFDESATNAVRLTREEIGDIIHEASTKDPLFKKGAQCNGDTVEPMTLERLQSTYTADERRAIYDAVVKTKTVNLDPFDPETLNEDGSKSKRDKKKSRLELEAELRDMKRRRVRYRGSCPDKNYSHVLRGVIETQMETYVKVIKKEDGIIERKPKYNTEEEKSSDYKSNRSASKAIRLSDASTSKQRGYDNFNTVYDKERKPKHVSGYHSKEDKYGRFNSNDYDNRHYPNRSEKYKFDTVKTAKDSQPTSSEYSEHHSKINSSHEFYDAYNKRKVHKEKDDKNRHLERDTKERVRHSYTDSHRKRRY